jgi:hypothetical protein
MQFVTLNRILLNRRRMKRARMQKKHDLWPVS